MATSNAGARSASPNATRIAAGAVELSSGRSSISLRNTSDANARVATEPRVSRAATAITSRAYVPATSTVTAPARTSPAVMASLLTAPRNEAPVSGSGKVKHDGSCANRTMDTGSSWSVSAAWTSRVAIGAKSFTVPTRGRETATRPCGATAAAPTTPSPVPGTHSETNAPCAHRRARAAVTCTMPPCAPGPRRRAPEKNAFTRNAPHAAVGSSSANPSPDSASANEAEAEAEASVATRNTRVASVNPRTSVASSGAHMDVTPPKPGGDTVVTSAATPKVTREGAPPAVSKKLPSSPRAPAGAKPSTGASGGARRRSSSPRSAAEAWLAWLARARLTRLTASRAYRTRFLYANSALASDGVRDASTARAAAEPSAANTIVVSPSPRGSIAVGAADHRRERASCRKLEILEGEGEGSPTSR